MVERSFLLNRTIDGEPVWRFAIRALGIGVMLILVYYFGRPGVLFFYQGF